VRSLSCCSLELELNGRPYFFCLFCRPGHNLRLYKPRPKARLTPGERSGGCPTPRSQLRPRSEIRVSTFVQVEPRFLLIPCLRFWFCSIAKLKTQNNNRSSVILYAMLCPYGPYACLSVYRYPLKILINSRMSPQFNIYHALP
jgi:hypothetical protein